MRFLRFFKEILGISSIVVIVVAACFALPMSIFYLLHLPFQWAFYGGIAVLYGVCAFINSKWKIQIPPKWEKPITFKRGAIAILLGGIWTLSMIVALRRVESSSGNRVGVFIAGFGILFLIFGQLEWMWNRDSRLQIRRRSVRESPNYNK